MNAITSQDGPAAAFTKAPYRHSEGQSILFFEQAARLSTEK
jgi:hypothetical protein